MGWRAAAIVFLVCGIGAGDARACESAEEPRTAIIAEVRPDGSFRLADGQEGRLAGIALAGQGAAAFRRLASDRNLTLQPVGRPDRWDRQAFQSEEIEKALLSRGLGHAAAQARGACLAPLLEAEAEARKARRGVWRRPGAYVLPASDGAALERRLGQHILAEGTIRSARIFRGRVYLNFARYWKSGLSLIIAEKEWPMFSGNLAPDAFIGKKVRARGRLDWRGGPAIVAGADERIELAD